MLGTSRVGLVGMVITLAACSSNQPVEKLGSTTENIQNGSDDGTAHPFVVGVCGGPGSNYCQLTCSGALILPNMVVSARHCVQDTGSTIDCKTSAFGAQLLPTNQYFVTTSSTMPGNKTVNKHVVKQIITPQPTSVCGNDLSILILNDVIDPSEATPAIPGTGYALTDHTQYSFATGFTAIGYGITSVSGNDSGTRRIKEKIPVQCIPGDYNIDCAGLGAPTDVFDPKEFIGGDGTCEGDSGSSAWEQDHFDKGTFVSMGVLSRGGQNGDMCTGSIYTRLDSWRDLIVQAAGTASNNWSLYPKPNPDWTVYVPPPPNPGPVGGGSDGGTPLKDAGIGNGGGGGGGGGANADACADSTCNGTADDTDASTGHHHTIIIEQGGCAMAPGRDPKPVPWKTVGFAAALGLALAARRRRARA